MFWDQAPGIWLTLATLNVPSASIVSVYYGDSYEMSMNIYQTPQHHIQEEADSSEMSVNIYDISFCYIKKKETGGLSTTLRHNYHITRYHNPVES